MAWGRGKKPQAVPDRGRRDREVIRQAPRQTFSYYGNRKAPTERVETKDTGRANSILHSSRPARSEQATSLLRYGVFWLCLIVGAICLVKVLVLTPSSRVVVTNAPGGTTRLSRGVTVYTTATDKILRQSFASRTKISLDTDGIARQLQAEFPELEHVVVTVPLIGSRPVVYVSPAMPVMRLETSAGAYVLTGRGYAYQDEVGMATASLPRLIDLSGVRPERGKPFLPQSTVLFALNASRQLAKAGIATEALILPQAMPYELDVRLTGKEYVIKYNLQEPARLQSGAAIALLQQLGTTNPVEYIDVRVPQRAYYK